jgi:hypothetical protein
LKRPYIYLFPSGCFSSVSKKESGQESLPSKNLCLSSFGGFHLY